MQRFFVPPAWLERETVTLRGNVAHQLSRVLRMRPGELLTLLDNSGWAYEVELERVGPDEAVGRIVGKDRPETEPRVRLVLYQALTKEKKLDWVFQKGTELGAAAFVPLRAARSIVEAREWAGEGRLARWQRIVIEAAEQSGRARVPEVCEPRTVAEAAVAMLPGTLTVIGTLSAETRPLGQVLRTTDLTTLQEMRIFIGPEGDFTPEEVKRAQAAGAIPVSLGNRVLRTETAGLVALSALLYALGELG